MSRTIVAIPARLQSQRLPNKPLLVLGDRPMIVHVAQRAAEAQVGEVYVATDDHAVRDACRAHDVQVRLTRPDHESGTDRIAELVEQLSLNAGDIVVNLQGDEPLTPPALIVQVAQALRDSEADMSTLSHRIEDPHDLLDPNVVKVVTDRSANAIYFSRAPIPWHREHLPDSAEHAVQVHSYQRHLGIYAYRVGFLRRYVTWAPSDIELLERLEQLRALDHGARIAVREAAQKPGPGVDTPRDLDRVRAIIEARSKSVDEAS